MAHYIDGFALPIPKDQLDTYSEVSEKVAKIWKEYGAIDYCEFVGDNFSLQGVRSFADVAEAQEDEVVIFGWVVFESKDARDMANQKVAADPRMPDLISPLTEASRPIFDAQRMMFGGFRALVKTSSS